MFAQGWQPLGSRSMALGNASVAINDVWGQSGTPAALMEKYELTSYSIKKAALRVIAKKKK